MDLKKIAAAAPREAGVYIFRDGENRIIYVGKARVLRSRLCSYFSGAKDIKTQTLLRRAAGLETIIVKDEYEALLLENTLIKQHSPRYNINLKDGKTYPMIRLTAPPFPRVFRTRHIIEDGSAYFGPFPNVGAMDKTLEVIDKIFPLRKCRRLKKRDAPCMYYHIGRCGAPCCGRIGEAEYGRQVERVRSLLSGETAPLLADLEAEMKKEAAALRFETAARFRNAMLLIGGLNESSAVVDFDPQGRDYIAWAAEGVLATYSVFSMRGGKLTGRELYRTHSASDEGEALESFIMAYYNGERPPPARIYVQGLGDEGAGITCIDAEQAEQAEWAAETGIAYHAGKDGPASSELPPGTAESFNAASLTHWFRENFGAEPEVIAAPDNSEGDSRPPARRNDSAPGPDGPDRHHLAILAMVRQNAREDLRQRLRERGAGPALDELRTVLSLRQRPETIEGFDIAQLDGKHPVASLISFRNGVPDRKNYRHFKLRTVVGIVDDFASLREAAGRRYTRLLRENRELPDLILIDGGIGQVNAVKGVLDALGIDCGLAGLAKRDEEIWLPGAKQPLRLSRRSEALKLLQQVRDETHRFATGLNRILRSGDLRLEILESVEGIGKRRAAALLRRFGGIAGIAAADPQAIAAACRCPAAAARAARAAARLAIEERAAGLGEPPRMRGSAAAAAASLAAGDAADSE